MDKSRWMRAIEYNGRCAKRCGDIFGVYVGKYAVIREALDLFFAYLKSKES